jgi:uncharacterized membrane protein YccF (DUF307 family)
MGLKTAVAGGVALMQTPASKVGQTFRVYRPGWAGVVGLLATAIYMLWLPTVARSWQATGDEPHYLLAAHSLVADGDFDLTNNYAQLDYLAFYFSKDITPQVRLDAAGRQILSHSPGLPLLIAPAYALGGRFGVLLFQSLLGGLLAAFTFKLAYFVSQDTPSAIVGTLFMALSPPLWLYHYLIYPELIAALLATIVVYYALTRRSAVDYAALLATISLGLLPWLNRRFTPMAVVLALVVVWSWRGQNLTQGRKDAKAQELKNNSASWRLGDFALNPFGLELVRVRNFNLTSVSATALLVTLISIIFVVIYNSQLSAPERADFTVPVDMAVVWSRLVRGSVGWLVDQQRGLFIYAPITIMALWGLPILISDSLKQRTKNWLILIPFAFSLAMVVVAGGFWIAWEVGPRYVVVALPTLPPLLALAWRVYRHSKVWVGITALLFGVSLANSLVILQNPELPYKSSLPLYYGDRLGLPLTEILPDLADYARLSPDDVGLEAVTAPDGMPEWPVPAGETRNLVSSEPLSNLPFGHYKVTWSLRATPHLPANTELARLSIKYLGGGQLFNRPIIAADLPADGSAGFIEADIFNPVVDRWRTPMILHAVTTGQSQLWVKELWFSPQPFYAFGLPYVLLALLLAGAVANWFDNTLRVKSLPLVGQQENQRQNRVGKLTSSRKGSKTQGLINNLASWRLGDFALNPFWLRLVRVSEHREMMGLQFWGITALALLLIAVGFLFYQQTRPGRTYDAGELSHFVGQPLADPVANDGRAWQVNPAVDPPQKATYGPFEFFEAGTYRVTFRVKLPEKVETDQEIARLQVNATANFEPLVSQPIKIDHFTRPDFYHELVLTVTNPRRQALSFEVDYLGVAPLVIDEVRIEEAGDER